MSTPAESFPPGTRVVVSGLVSRQEFNGEQGCILQLNKSDPYGHILALNESTGRGSVRFIGGKKFTLKPASLSRTVVAGQRVAMTDGELLEQAEALHFRGVTLLE